MNTDQLIGKLNLLKLKGLGNLKTGDALANFLYRLDFGRVRQKSGLKIMGKILVRAFLKRHTCEVYSEEGVLFYCSSVMAERQDHYRNFISVSGLYKDRMTIASVRKFRLSMVNAYQIIYVMDWNRKLKKLVKDHIIRWEMIHVLFTAAVELREINMLIKKHRFRVKLLVNMEDFTTCPHFLAQQFQNMRIPVVVLQHGMYNITQLDKKVQKYIQAEYLLAYSPYAKRLIEWNGTYRGEILTAGCIQFLNDRLNERKIDKITDIGVFLEDGKTASYNLKLLKIAEAAAAATGAGLIIKLHPSDSPDNIKKYRNAISDQQVIKAVYLREKTALEAEQEIDAMVCICTTCFVETVFQMIPSFLLYDADCPFCYRGIDLDIYFKDPVELVGLLGSVGTQGEYKKRMELKRYICGPDDPREEYSKIISRLTCT